jgi:hypothetical protein
MIPSERCQLHALTRRPFIHFGFDQQPITVLGSAWRTSQRWLVQEIGFGGSTHRHAPGRPARDFSFSGNLNGTWAVTANGFASPFTSTFSNRQPRVAVRAESFNAEQVDPNTRASLTDPEASTLSSTVTTPSSPAERDCSGYTGLTSLIFRGALMADICAACTSPRAETTPVPATSSHTR